MRIATLSVAPLLAACSSPQPTTVGQGPKPATEPVSMEEQRERQKARQRDEEPLAWRTEPPVPERRTEVSAATDGERIYLAGGFGAPDDDDDGDPDAPRALWAYAPEHGAWEEVTELPAGVHHAPFAYYEGQLFILGGFADTTFNPVGDVHIYDLAEDRWTEGAPMPTPRGAAGFTVLDGRIHVIGGNAESERALSDREGVAITEDRSVNVHEAYDPAEDAWVELEPMPTPRNHLGAAAHAGRIHAILGREGGDYTMRTHEIYDAETGRWEPGESVPSGRSGVAVLAHEGYIYGFGGEDLAEGEERVFAAAERLDPDTGAWERLPSMPTARHGMGAAAFEDSIYVVSGGPGPAFHFGDANERLLLPP